MNLKDLESIIQIDEERNLTHAAKKLYLTPSALNQKLHNLEKEVGTELFVHTKNGWIPTEAGTIYLEAARKILFIKKNTYEQIADTLEKKQRHLAIGIPPERGAQMFTSIYPMFHEMYPDIIINVRESNVRQQLILLDKKELDLAFVTLGDFQKSDDEYIDLHEEEFVVAVPSPLELLTSNDVLFDLQTLKNQPFALMHPDSTVRACVDVIFDQSGFTPNIIFEAARSQTILEMVAANLCCSVIPFSATLQAPDNVTFFTLPTHPFWKIAACYSKGSYLSKPKKDLIDLAGNYWEDLLE